MAKSKNKRKSGKQSNIKPKLSLKAYIQKVVRKLPLHECLIYDNWQEEGKTQIIVSRRKSRGSLIIGFYLVDLQCLGLKDTFYREMDQWEYEEMKAQISADMEQESDIELVTADPILAFNIIYGAIEYAEDLGFSPAKDFAVTEYILNDVEQIPFLEIEFGKDGKPYYVSGPNDNVDRVLKTLDKFVGKGNYHYLFHFDKFDEAEEHTFLTLISQSDRAEEKTKKLPDEQLFTFLIQLLTADCIHELTNGILEEIDDLVDEEDKEMVLNHIIEFFKHPPDGQKAITGKEIESVFKAFVYQTFNQVSYYGHLDFLFEEDYLPLIDDNTLENIEKLSPEEKSKIYIDVTSRMDAEAIFNHSAHLEAMQKLEILKAENNHEIVNVEDENILASLREKVIQAMKERYEGEFLEEDIEIIHKAVAKVVQDYKEKR